MQTKAKETKNGEGRVSASQRRIGEQREARHGPRRGARRARTLIKRLNMREPERLHRSPTFKNAKRDLSTIKFSRPERCIILSLW